MRNIIFIFVVLLGAVFIKIPEYVELNDLAIIKDIGIEYDNGRYTIILKEVIPKKDVNGINYEYKYYEESSDDFNKAFNNIKENTNKKIYLNKVKTIITNYDKTDKFIKDLNINPDEIIHIKKNIKKELVKY